MKRMLLVLALVFVSSCASPRALKDMCLVQKGVLTRYVEVANPQIEEDWQEIGKKLLRNQEAINKLVGAENGQR